MSYKQIAVRGILTVLFASAILLNGLGSVAAQNLSLGPIPPEAPMRLAQNDQEEDAQGSSATALEFEYEAEPQREHVADPEEGRELKLEEDGGDPAMQGPGSGIGSDFTGQGVAPGADQSLPAPPRINETPQSMAPEMRVPEPGQSDCQRLLFCLGGVQGSARRGPGAWRSCAGGYSEATVKIAEQYAACAAQCSSESCIAANCADIRRRCERN